MRRVPMGCWSISEPRAKVLACFWGRSRFASRTLIYPCQILVMGLRLRFLPRHRGSPLYLSSSPIMKEEVPQVLANFVALEVVQIAFSFSNFKGPDLSPPHQFFGCQAGSPIECFRESDPQPEEVNVQTRYSLRPIIFLTPSWAMPTSFVIGRSDNIHGPWLRCFWIHPNLWGLLNDEFDYNLAFNGYSSLEDDIVLAKFKCPLH